MRTVVRKKNRYSVSLLLRPDARLGDSRAMARRLLTLLEGRFKKDPHFKKGYISFMNGYEQLDHGRPADPLEPDTTYYFIIHHEVAVELRFKL